MRINRKIPLYANIVSPTYMPMQIAECKRLIDKDTEKYACFYMHAAREWESRCVSSLPWASITSPFYPFPFTACLCLCPALCCCVMWLSALCSLVASVVYLSLFSSLCWCPCWCFCVFCVGLWRVWCACVSVHLYVGVRVIECLMWHVDRCLVTLRLDLRLHCLYFLLPAIRKSSYVCTAEQIEEADAQVVTYNFARLEGVYHSLWLCKRLVSSWCIVFECRYVWAYGGDGLC